MAASEVSMEEACIAKHRKEKKDLQAQIQQLKHAIPKGDKKRKKDVAAQIAIMESELDARQEQELLALKISNVNIDAVPSEESLSVGVEAEDAVTNDVGCLNNVENNSKKSSKAQRRKAKKDQKVQEREERIKEQDVVNEQSARTIEAEKIRTILRSRGLLLFEIAADGNCLFSAIEDQLRQLGIESSVSDLRSQTAHYMIKHPDEFMPFLVHEASGEMYSEDEYTEYCKRLESTSEWGGQTEIRALSEVLERPIEVIQADGPCVTVGEHFHTDVLRLVYHRHKFGLGEHYNSARRRPVIQDGVANS